MRAAICAFEKVLGKVVRRFIKVLLQTASIILLPLFRIATAKKKVQKVQPIFIIGAPRTGSTALYQALTNVFDVAYIDNLAAALYKNLPMGIWFSRLMYGNRPHNNFKADFGSTQDYGWHAPSECGQFWYRWLPVESHFVDSGDISASFIKELRSEIEKAQTIVGVPLLFKNLNAGQRLRIISEAFPQARIIYLKRDPRFTAASILQARKKKNIPTDQWWSIKPKNFRELLELDEAEMAVAQVYYLERQIEEDLSLFSPDNVHIVHYNDLSERKLNCIGQWFGLTKKEVGKAPSFFQDTASKLDSGQWEKLTKLTKEYSFSKDSYI